IAAAAYVVFIVGTKKRKKIPSSLNPSILPASIKSFGNILVFCRNKKIKNAVVIVGKIEAANVSIPIADTVCAKLPNNRYNEIIIDANGIIIDTKRILNTQSFPRLRYISNP